MTHGDVWTPTCAHCGKRSSLDDRWQLEKPTDGAPHERDCCDATAILGAAPIASWEHDYVRRVDFSGRRSGFSTSDSDFTPHWNRAFGKRVGSLAEMKALQAARGTNDVVVKGDGAERHAPRDLMRRIKRNRDLREVVESGQGEFDAGNGVRLKFSRQDKED